MDLNDELAEKDKEIERLYGIIVEQQKEIERLKDTKTKYFNENRLLEKDNVRLINIIKEVREYIKANAMYSEREKICCDDLYTTDCDKLLEILDKVEENK